MIGRIYKITNLINGKIYIGQTIQTIKERWYRHISNAKSLSSQERNMVIKRAIRKYGKENFTIELIEECEDKNLDEREIYYIKYYDSYINGYNSTLGGKQNCTKFNSKVQKDLNIIKELYLEGFSLKEIAKEYNVDKATIKTALSRINVPLRKRTPYKFTIDIKYQILKEVNSGISRKEIILKYHISKGYLSQIINRI